MTYDTATDTWHLYLDGDLERDARRWAATSRPESDSIQHAALGTAMTSTGVAAGFFNGVLDEVRIWNVARSQAQIQATRDQELTAAPASSPATASTEGTGTAVSNSRRRRRQRHRRQRPALGGRLLRRPTPTRRRSPTGHRRRRHGNNLVASRGPPTASPTWPATASSAAPACRSTRPATACRAALITGTDYTDSTAVNGTAYHYVVVAVDGIGNRSAAFACGERHASVAAGAALDFDGTNDHVTFGTARRRSA